MKRFFLASIFIFAFITACSMQKKAEKEIAFEKLFAGKEMNKKIKLTVLKSPGLKNMGYPISVFIENISTDSIWFPNDSGVKILTYNEIDGAWKDVPNKVSYSGSPVIVESRIKAPFNSCETVVSPDLPEGNPVMIRVVVMGIVYRDGKSTEEGVGGWIDVTIPQLGDINTNDAEKDISQFLSIGK